MMQEGLLEEVQGLVERGFVQLLRRANVIGYNEILDFLDGRCDLEAATASIKQNHRRYAKRQLTWFRHQTGGEKYPDSQTMRRAASERLKFLGWVS